MKRISQRDIARQLGVNVSTVSRALRGLDGVSPELKQQIEKLAEDAGYRPNPFALSLRYDTTRTIGIVVPDVSYNQYAHIVKSIEAEARKAGYMSIITDTDDTFENEVNCLEMLVNMHVEGIIICLSQDIGGPNQQKQMVDRKHGYLEALRERGIPIRTELVKSHRISFNSGLSDTLDLLQLPEPPDAILAAHGLLAISALQALTNSGKRIPDDVAVVGYMSDWVSEMSHPRISFVRQNLKEIGCKAFRLLLDQMNGDDSVQHVVVKARLELRDSTK